METTKAKFTDAEAHCNRQVQNGHLASILDEQTNKFIAHLAGEKNLWVGGKRDGGESEEAEIRKKIDIKSGLER